MGQGAPGPRATAFGGVGQGAPGPRTTAFGGVGQGAPGPRATALGGVGQGAPGPRATAFGGVGQGAPGPRATAFGGVGHGAPGPANAACAANARAADKNALRTTSEAESITKVSRETKLSSERVTHKWDLRYDKSNQIKKSLVTLPFGEEPDSAYGFR